MVVCSTAKRQTIMTQYTVDVDLYSTDQPVRTEIELDICPAGADWDQVLGAIETALHEQFEPDDVAHFEVSRKSCYLDRSCEYCCGESL